MKEAEGCATLSTSIAGAGTGDGKGKERNDDGEQAWTAVCWDEGSFLPAFCRILQLDDGTASRPANVRPLAA